MMDFRRKTVLAAGLAAVLSWAALAHAKPIHRDGVNALELEAALAAAGFSPTDYETSQDGFGFTGTWKGDTFLVYTAGCNNAEPAAPGFNEGGSVSYQRCATLVLDTGLEVRDRAAGLELANIYDRKNYFGRSYIFEFEGDPDELVVDSVIFLTDWTDELYLADFLETWRDLILPAFREVLERDASIFAQTGAPRSRLVAQQSPSETGRPHLVRIPRAASEGLSVRVPREDSLEGAAKRSWDWINSRQGSEATR